MAAGRVRHCGGDQECGQRGVDRGLQQGCMAGGRSRQALGVIRNGGSGWFLSFCGSLVDDRGLRKGSSGIVVLAGQVSSGTAGVTRNWGSGGVCCFAGGWWMIVNENNPVTTVLFWVVASCIEKNNRGNFELH